MVDGDVKPWERQSWDTAASYRAFHDFYLLQDPPRLIDAAFRGYRDEPEGSKRTANAYFRRWARGHGSDDKPIKGAIPWEARAAAWDDHLRALDREMWERRYKDLREREWQVANELLAKAEKMLERPLDTAKSNTEDGKEIVVVKPKWGPRDAALMAKTGSELARMAAEIAPLRQRHEHTGEDGGPIILKRQIEEMTDDELLAIARGGGDDAAET